MLIRSGVAGAVKQVVNCLFYGSFCISGHMVLELKIRNRYNRFSFVSNTEKRKMIIYVYRKCLSQTCET